MLSKEDLNRFTPSDQFSPYQYQAPQQRQAKESSHDEEMLCIDHGGVDGDHSDVDSVAVVDQPRRVSDSSSHFQPSQIEEKLQNHRLLNTGGVKQADKQVVSGATTTTGRAPRRASLWNGMVACLSPVVGYFKKEKQPILQQDEWEIEFADISELDFIGSGAQGAVFAGEYLGKKVAVKKVKDPKYCDEAWNLRKLDHPNIVKLM